MPGAQRTHKNEQERNFISCTLFTCTRLYHACLLMPNKRQIYSTLSPGFNTRSRVTAWLRTFFNRDAEFFFRQLNHGFIGQYLKPKMLVFFPEQLGFSVGLFRFWFV
ncbi:MAG: hypothetical protein V4543_15885 [Bacteroidota bacterium]